MSESSDCEGDSPTVDPEGTLFAPLEGADKVTEEERWVAGLLGVWGGGVVEGLAGLCRGGVFRV